MEMHSSAATPERLMADISPDDGTVLAYAVPFRHRRQTLHWQAKLILNGQAFYLLLDHPDDSVLQWQAHLRYLLEKARRLDPSQIPSLLLLCNNPFRAEAALRLAATMGVVSPVFVVMIPANGLLQANWQTWRDGAVQPAQPFALKPVSSPAPRRRRRLAAPSLPTSPLAALNPQALSVLRTIFNAPMCPRGLITQLTQRSTNALDDSLHALFSADFVGHIDTSGHLSTPLYFVTDRGVKAYLAHTLQPEHLLVRYRFFCADHQRRWRHTVAAYGFFETLLDLCARRSQALGVLGDGHASYALVEFESEFRASDYFYQRGAGQHWRPDGYGALRVGETITRFWIEIDGTTHAPSRHSPIVWERKMAGLCDYLLSERWTFRYESQPVMLVITTDHRNRPLICDALHYAARARGMPSPQVLMATQAALAQRGPLAPIWFDLTKNDDQSKNAFAGLDQPLDLAKRLSMIDMVQHWR